MRIWIRGLSWMMWMYVGLVCVGCKKSPQSASYTLRCSADAVHCKGSKRTFGRTVCLSDPKGLKEELKKAALAAQKTYVSEGVCTQKTTFKCVVTRTESKKCKS